jgi:hypothetical protein
MTKEYGSQGFTIHGNVEVFNSPEVAALNCSLGSSLLDCLTPAEASEFVKDWELDQQGRKAPRKQSTLTEDIAAFKRRTSRRSF